jgi:hypothetical protein
MADKIFFTDKYLQVYDPVSKSLEVRRKSRSDGNLTLVQSMELINVLLQRFQTTFRVNEHDKNLIWFPFLFVEPEEGDKILNKTTGETYTVDQIVKNPKTNVWEGLVRLDLTHAPLQVSRHELSFYEDKNYVTFDHSFSTETPNDISANSSGEGDNAPPMRPTIAWSLARKEPGAYGQPFGPKKQLKPVVREELKDPMVDGYTVIVNGQFFDNIVQFDALYIDNKSAESLVEWFEQFMRLNSWLLQKEGVAQLYFTRRLENTTVKRWGQPLWKRSLQYYFRTEQLEAVYTRDLLRLNITLETLTSMNGRDVGPRYIADQRVTGDLTASGYRRLFYDASGTYLFGDIDLLQ